MRIAIGVVLAGVLLAGCDSVAITDSEARNQIAAEYNALVDSYGDPALRVPAASVPLSGTATYDGAINILVDTAATTNILGEAEMLVNFGADSVSAGFGNFYGVVNGGPVTAFTETDPVEATGAIDVSQPGNLFIQTVLDGTLTSDDTGTVVALGPMQLDGSFRDTAPSRFSAPDGIVMQSGLGSIRVGGVNFANETGNDCETCVWVVLEAH
jgi:hypothetical protein